MILCATRHHAQTHFKFRALERYPSAGQELSLSGSESWLARVCWCGLPASLYLLESHSAFQPSWGWDDLNFFRLLGSNSSPESVWNLGAYILPQTKITESNCLSTVRSRRRKNNFYGTLEGTSTHRIALSIRSEMSTYAMWQFIYPSTMWGFTGWLLSSQKFPFLGGGFMLVSTYRPTCRLSFQTNAVKVPLAFTRMSPLFNFNFFSPKSGCVFLFGDKKIVHKQFVSYAFN